MAGRRTLDLGTVGFGLVADTRQLQNSLKVLKDFGRLVNAMSDETDSSVVKLYNKYAQIEKILTTLQSRVVNVTNKMKQAGVAQTEIDKVTAAYKRLNATLTQNAAQISRHEIARGTVGMSAILQRGSALAAAKETHNLATAFRDLERAAIIAVGPLSGIGARMAVLAALFETTSAKMALTVAGTAGVLTGFGLLTAAAIRATIEMQKYNAILIAATGSEALIGDEFNYIIGVANRLGVNVKSLTESYGKFATAARLSGVSLENTRKIFEGATTASSAFRLDNERTGLVFLALEQMFSKGVVTMEELRRQLGDLLPGSFGLAAKAMGVTQAKLTSMIKQAQVLPQDLLPKLADALQAAFGPSAQKSAESLQGEMNKVGTATFALLRAFDQTSRASQIFTSAVRDTANVMNYLTTHMNEVFKIIGAMMGAAVGFGLVLTKWTVVIPAVISAVVSLTRAIMAFNIAAALAALGTGNVLKLLGKIIVVAGVAYGGYKLMGKMLEDNSRSATLFIDQAEQWVEQVKHLGETYEQTAVRMQKATEIHLRDVDADIQATQAQIKAEQAHIASQSKLILILQLAARMKFGFNLLGGTNLPDLKKQLDDLDKERDRLFEILKSIMDMKYVSAEGATEPSEAWKSWIKGIEKSVRDLQGLDKQIAAAKLGSHMMQEAKGLTEALDLMAKQPTSGRGNLAGISKVLRDAGIEGKNLTEQLARMFTLMDARKKTLQELESDLNRFATAEASVTKMFTTVYENINALKAADPEAYKKAERMNTQLNDMRTAMEKAKASTEQITEALGYFKSALVEQQGLEDANDRIKKLTSSLNELQNRLGDPGQRAAERFRDQLDLIARAQKEIVPNTGKPLLDEQHALMYRSKIYDDYYAEMVGKAGVFYREMTNLFRSLEDGVAKTWTDILLNGTSTWKDLYQEILRQTLEFMAKILVIQPILKGLFGSIYTHQRADVGTGLLEGGLGALIGAPSIPAFASGSSYVPRTMLAMLHRGEKVVPPGGGGGGDNIHISIAIDASNNSKVSGNAGAASDLSRKIEAGVKAVLIKERRPGGILSASGD